MTKGDREAESREDRKTSSYDNSRNNKPSATSSRSSSSSRRERSPAPSQSSTSSTSEARSSRSIKEPPTQMMSRQQQRQAILNEEREKIRIATYETIDKEVELAKSRSAQEDYEEFKKKSTMVKDLMKKLKYSVAGGDNDSIELIKKQLINLLLDMKTINRFDKVRLKSSRENVSMIRSKVDECHLRLQNLLYEVLFIEREIKRSLDYKSRADDIDLDDIESFYREAPEVIVEKGRQSGVGGEATGRNDEAERHRLTLARLEWELKQRQQLAEQLRLTELLKLNDIDEMRNIQELLQRLRSSMSNVVDSLKPVISEINPSMSASATPDIGSKDDGGLQDHRIKSESAPNTPKSEVDEPMEVA